LPLHLLVAAAMTTAARAWGDPARELGRDHRHLPDRRLAQQRAAGYAALFDELVAAVNAHARTPDAA
jgi:hypothetical protein